MAFVKLNQTPPAFPLFPTGSLLQTNSKFGHELIVGPVVGDHQIVGHKEPGLGACPEYLASVMQRYQITNVIPPVSNEHGLVTWQRKAQQFGDPWAPLDNCQHGARRAYYGKAESPTATGVGIIALSPDSGG
ncbi:MAG TPA: hypothetical protein VKT81_19830 [Bryobacteraceae bacterium]|nr:hypothetical protein [Bryobacteraceae bacterium]